MLNYYPYVIQRILEFKALTDTEGIEMDLLFEESEDIVNDAYLTTMGEDRIVQWENVLGISYISTATLQDRRDAIIARIRSKSKLNTMTINSIVNSFTGGTAKSYFQDSTLYVVIDPPPTNKQFIFSNVERELTKRKPAHITLVVSRNYVTWGEVKDGFTDWEHLKSFTKVNGDGIISKMGDVFNVDESGTLNLLATWDDVRLLTPSMFED